MVDALGNPLAFLADKAFDADERVIEPLLAAGKKFVIPSISNRTV
jgi:hypothetical protein